MTAILFVFLPNLYSVIERLQYALAWFGVLIAVDLWVGRNKAYDCCTLGTPVTGSLRLRYPLGIRE
jgi:hypothetical protein